MQGNTNPNSNFNLTNQNNQFQGRPFGSQAPIGGNQPAGSPFGVPQSSGITFNSATGASTNFPSFNAQPQSSGFSPQFNQQQPTPLNASAFGSNAAANLNSSGGVNLFAPQSSNLSSGQAITSPFGMSASNAQPSGGVTFTQPSGGVTFTQPSGGVTFSQPSGGVTFNNQSNPVSLGNKTLQTPFGIQNQPQGQPAGFNMQPQGQPGGFNMPASTQPAGFSMPAGSQPAQNQAASGVAIAQPGGNMSDIAAAFRAANPDAGPVNPYIGIGNKDEGEFNIGDVKGKGGMDKDVFNKDSVMSKSFNMANKSSIMESIKENSINLYNLKLREIIDMYVGMLDKNVKEFKVDAHQVFEQDMKLIRAKNEYITLQKRIDGEGRKMDELLEALEYLEGQLDEMPVGEATEMAKCCEEFETISETIYRKMEELRDDQNEVFDLANENYELIEQIDKKIDSIDGFVL